MVNGSCGFSGAGVGIWNEINVSILQCQEISVREGWSGGALKSPPTMQGFLMDDVLRRKKFLIWGTKGLLIEVGGGR